MSPESSALAIFEAALRALAAAAAVGVGFRALRIRNVLVQKAAWSVVLMASLTMPFAPQWHVLPAWAALRIPSVASYPVSKVPAVSTPVAASQAAESTFRPSPAFPGTANHNFKANKFTSHASQIAKNHVKKSQLTGPVERFSMRSASPVADPQPGTPVLSPAVASTRLTITILALLLYLAIAALFMLRLLAGAFAAARLWIAAAPATELPIGESSIHVRSSDRVSSPVNIGSGIVLPIDYAAWGEEKLLIVLAHERSHVRQCDFYLQLAAGVYASVFWFSPLGWWLKRKLYELGEAISDRAGLENAASRTSYAQLLLEFAALPRPTLTGVAMARTNHLSQRIERLLDESNFRQSFATGGRRAWLAAVIVPLVFFTASTLVRVDAATTAVQAQPATAAEGASTPAQVTDQAPVAAPAPAAAPATQSAPDAFPAPPPTTEAVPTPPEPPAAAVEPHPVPVAPLPPGVAVVPMAPRPPITVVVPRVSSDFYALPGRLDADTERLAQSAQIAADMMVARAQQYLYRTYDQTSDGDPYALVDSDGKILHRFNDDFQFDNSVSQQSIDKGRQMTHGAFLWFEHDGKTYVVDDPTIVAQIEAMNKPMEDLQNQMKELGKQMKDLGGQQRDMDRKMRAITVPTPDLSGEIADLNNAAANLKAKEGGAISQKDLADMQREIGRIQGQLGKLQGQIGAQQGEIGGQMGKFGSQMGALGGQMGELGKKMGETARENQSKMKGIITDSLSNGKARPVQ